MDQDLLSLLGENYQAADKASFRELWNCISKGNGSIEDLDAFQEFRFHNVIMLNDYLDRVLASFRTVTGEGLQHIDEGFRAYIITFLYCNCLSVKEETRSIVRSSIKIYIKLIMIPRVGQYLTETNMTHRVLRATLDLIKDNGETDENKLEILRCLSQYFTVKCQEMGDDNITIFFNFFVSALVLSVDSIVDSLHDLAPVPKVCADFLETITEPKANRVFYGRLGKSLFRCFTFEYMSQIPNKQSAIHVISLLIHSTRWKQHNSLLAMNKIFVKQLGIDTLLASEAAIYMNSLEVNSFKYITDNMETFLSYEHNERFFKNIMNLIYELIINPYSAQTRDIISSYATLINAVILLFKAIDKKVIDMAIQVVFKICSLESPVLEKAIALLVKERRCSTGHLLIAVEQLSDEVATERNSMLLKISLKFLLHTHLELPYVVSEAVAKLTKGCKPESLKAILPDLLNVFYTLATRSEFENAEIILAVICRMALFNDRGAETYSQIIYKSIINPFTNKSGLTFSNEIFNKSFFTAKYNYKMIVSRCKNYMRPTHVYSLIEHLEPDKLGCASGLCLLANYVDITFVEGLTNFICNSFEQIASRSSMGPLAMALKKFLAKGPRVISVEHADRLKILQALIISAIHSQKILIPCLKPTLLLYLEINVLLNKELDNVTVENIMSHANDRAIQAVTGDENRDDTSILYLSELSIIFNRIPNHSLIKAIDDYLIDDIFFKDNDFVYVQSLTAEVNMSLMKRALGKYVLNHLREAMNSPNQIMKVYGFKLMHVLVKELTHEYEEIVDFSLREVVKGDPCLARLCAICIEDAVHHDYVKLNAEKYFKFVHNLGSSDLHMFMKELLSRRFVLSNQNDIARFYVQTIIYSHVYSKFPNYAIPAEFDQDLVKMRMRIDKSDAIPFFLFTNLSVKKKFDVLCEICPLLEGFIKGQCKVDSSFFNVLTDFIATFKYMKTPKEELDRNNYFNNVCKMVEKQIVSRDPKSKPQNYYKEFTEPIKRLTITLLKLLFLENEMIADKIQDTLFESIIHWIDFFKFEIMHYVHEERGKEYDMYMSKLILFYKKNKKRFT